MAIGQGPMGHLYLTVYVVRCQPAWVCLGVVSVCGTMRLCLAAFKYGMQRPSRTSHEIPLQRVAFRVRNSTSGERKPQNDD